MATKYYIVPNIRTKSAAIKESSGVEYLCPTNTVLTGRYHKGDENGQTQYEYATLKVVDEQGKTVQASIVVTDIQWSSSIKESDGTFFKASSGRVLVGRYHKGDENGYTKYATAIVKVNGVQAQTIDDENSAKIKESSGVWYVTPTDRVLVGRYHKGDENGETYYISAKILVVSGFREPAPNGTRIIPVNMEESQSFKESDFLFQCESNKVITGRYRSGDENGTTKFQYASLKAVDSNGVEILGDITIEEFEWVKISENLELNEDGVKFDADLNRVIIGWKHKGDENAPIYFATGIVKFNGYPTFIKDYSVTEFRKDNLGWLTCGNNAVMTGFHHYGDENGDSYYGTGLIVTDKPYTNPYPFNLIVSIASDEKYYPMSATDFIILSRLRQHLGGGERDKGYNKDTGKFEVSDSKATNFYNIPCHIVNSYYCKAQHKRLYNLRPLNKEMHYDVDSESNYFLQSFIQLVGNYKPTGRIPTYVNERDYISIETGKLTKYIDFWLFFGYDYALAEIASIKSSHQGDWEHVKVKLVDNKIVGAWLSQHTSFKYYQAENLELTSDGKKETLTVYCADGSHAIYPKGGVEYPIYFLGTIADHDITTEMGVKWIITNCIEPLMSQPWVLFGGAWGEVGQRTDTTGPLGPWYKRYNYWYKTPLILSQLISSNEVLIIPDQLYISNEYKEDSGHKFEGSSNMVMIGRRHTGDEKGETTCLFATLRAINHLGVTQSGTISITDIKWSDTINENDCNYTAPTGYIILGRKHVGDENGSTQFKIGKIVFNGKDTTVINANSIIPYQEYTENAGVFFQTEPYLLYYGRYHKGDENGITYNIQAIVKCTK